jgi:hypothetical protein
MPKATRRTSRKHVEELTRRLRKIPKYKTKLYLEKEARIQEALKAYHDPSETEITSLRIAASVFDVSYTTLYGREQGAKPLSENGGHNTRLNEAQEMSLIWYMDIAIERGFPLRYNMVTRAATQILEAVGLINGNTDRLGNNWALRWVEKQRKLGRYHAVCTKPMDYRRKEALTPELVLETFARLQAILDKYEIQIFDIYNVNEIGFRIGCIASSTVITHKNIREVRAPDNYT